MMNHFLLVLGDVMETDLTLESKKISKPMIFVFNLISSIISK